MGMIIFFMEHYSTDFRLSPDQKKYSGKVRDTYAVGNKIVLFSTDKISCFDVILPQVIPHKGSVLNGISKYFFEELEKVNSKDFIVNSWVKKFPAPQVSIGQLCEPIEIEVIVRGYLLGSAWRSYEDGSREICGVKLPDGMNEFDAFSEPIITPTTKAQEGHDEDISVEQILSQGLVDRQVWPQITTAALKLFALGQKLAREKGLVLSDTKYEFGINSNGALTIMDEIQTPDSSRYFYENELNSYNPCNITRPQQLSKEFVREWLISQGWNGQDQNPPEMPAELIKEISNKYIDLYELITGQTFTPDDSGINEIEKIIRDSLN